MIFDVFSHTKGKKEFLEYNLFTNCVKLKQT